MILYYLTLPLLYFISILPDAILYKCSDALNFINYKFIKYRKKVIYQNLRNSFPEKSDIEIETLTRSFMAILMDYVLESVKALTASKAYLMKKGKIEIDPELYKLAAENRNIIMSAGHVGSQELLNLYIAAHPNFPFTLKATYHAMANKQFDGLFYKSRSKYGTEMYSMKETYAAIDNQELNRPFAFVLANDQSAPPHKAYWTNFLNQETSFYKGMAIFAQKYNMPVYYINLGRSKKRGDFVIYFEKIVIDPNSISETEILERHVKLLEKNILNDIPTWFWSHRRWKHKRPNV